MRPALALCFFCLMAANWAPAQQSSAQASQQEPRTAPQVQEVLSSYEGQKVVAVEVAGQPGLDDTALQQFMAQKQDEPFARAKIDQTIAALKNSGKAKEVELEIRPVPEGVRVMFVLQPAIYFGIYTFPGAGRFGYSRLLQVSDYPPRGAYSAIDVENTSKLLVKFFQQNGYFEAEVKPTLRNAMNTFSRFTRCSSKVSEKTIMSSR